MGEREEVVSEILKRGRGRPKGSKNKPKKDMDVEVQVIQRPQRATMQPKIIKKSSKKGSQDTFFTIKPKQGSKCYYQTEITVDYTPHKEQDHEKMSIVPRLNTDSKPHIPGFVMEMDRHYYQKNDQRYQDDHKNKILDYTKPKSRLVKKNNLNSLKYLIYCYYTKQYLPKPAKRHTYCCVCKQSYEDYLEHVTSNNHKKAYHLNDFAKQIKQICDDYSEISRNNSKNDSTDFLTDQTSQENFDDCQILPQDSSTTQKFTSRKDNKIAQKQSFTQFLLINNNNNNTMNNSTVNNNFRQDLTRGNSQFFLGQKPLNLAVSNSKSNASTASTAGNMGGNFPFEIPQLSAQSLLNVSNTKVPQNNINFSTSNMFVAPMGSSNPQYFLNFPVSPNNHNSENEIIIQDINIHQTQMNHSTNPNGMNVCGAQSTSNNNNNLIRSNDKGIFIKQNPTPSSNNILPIVNGNSAIQLNGKRKSESTFYPSNMEMTRKHLQISPSNIIDLTEEVLIDQNLPLITASLPQQNHMPSANSLLRYAKQYVV